MFSPPPTALPTFGQIIRAQRLCWHWSPQHGAFVRLHADGTNAYIELHPVGLVPDGRGQRKGTTLYVCWWEAGPSLLDLVAELRSVKRVKRHIQFTVPLARVVESVEA